MSSYNYDIRSINLNLPDERAVLYKFLEQEGLVLGEDLDYAVCMEDDGRIIAAGCASGNILKCIAVNDEYQGEGLTNSIMTLLRLWVYHQGYESLFLFTKPRNREVFRNLGFFSLSETEDVLLMENREKGCEDYVSSLTRPEEQGRAGAIVMNCNPFTLGHRYLIEQACSSCDTVHLFILKEDLSIFPFEIRMDLVRRGTEDLQNLYIHEGRDYIISRATFPSYFVKDQKIIDESHTRIDLDLFARKIAPELGITYRFVGEEPFCPVTSYYNRMMKEILPSHGIEVRKIPRREIGGKAVSATLVRQALAEGRLEEIKDMVPPSTWRFLNSPEAAPYVKRAQDSERRACENR